MVRDSKVLDHQWLPARNVGPTEIPAYGAVVCVGKTIAAGRWVWEVRCTTADDFLKRQIVLNGPQAIAVNKTGSITTADVPARALSPGASGRSYGTVPGSYVLSVDLPGLVSIGAGDHYTRDYCQRTFWAEVEGVSNDEETFGWMDEAENGSWTYAHPVGYLTMQFTLRLPRNGQDKDPNIQAGNIVPWTISLSFNTPEPVVLNCLDDKIGTVKITDVTIPPQGWRTYDFGNRLIRGGTDGATGGNKTHTHGTVQVHEYDPPHAASEPLAISGTGENVPPYMIVRFIERFE